MIRIFSGIQPTNDLHIGNYLGALRPWLQTQNDKDKENFFCIVDLHALTTRPDPVKLSQAVHKTLATYLACGLSPEKSCIFVQSHVPAHSQLAWILNCFTPLGWLNRMTQFKDKAGKHKEQANLGLYSYPVLQAADILAYKATHVPVGEDQKQHIELCRDIAGTFNAQVGKDFFPLPHPEIPVTSEARIMSLREGTCKMSKSDVSEYSRIHLTDEAETIVLKIRKAKTDSKPLAGSVEEMSDRPEALNLLTIYASFAHCSVNQVCQQFSGTSFSSFKQDLGDLLVSTLSPIREKIDSFLKEKSYLSQIMMEGRQKATLVADQTLKDVFSLIGV